MGLDSGLSHHGPGGFWPAPPCYGVGFATPCPSLLRPAKGLLAGRFHAAASQPPRGRACARVNMMGTNSAKKSPGGLLGLALAAESRIRDVQDRVRSSATGRVRLSFGGVMSSLFAAAILLLLSLLRQLLLAPLLFLLGLLTGKRHRGGEQAATSPAKDVADPLSSEEAGEKRDPERQATGAQAAVAQESAVSSSAGMPGVHASTPNGGTAVSAQKGEDRASKVKRGLGQVTEQDLMEMEWGGKAAEAAEVEGMMRLRDRVLALTKEERATMCEPWLDGLTPFDLLRYIRGNGHKIEEAETKLLQSARWRKEYNVSSILAEHASSIDGFFPDLETREVDWLGEEADLEKGRPSLLYRSAVHTPLERHTEDWIRFFVHQCEHARVHHPEKQVLVLVDRVGSGLSNQDPTVLRALAPVILDHYPDTIGCVLIAPVNTVLFVIWGLVSLILDDATKRRMKLLKGKDWKSQLVKCVHQDSLPVRLGGTNEQF